MSHSSTTTNHEEIRKWAEERGGRPSRVRDTGGKQDPGILRLDFGDQDDGLEEISWDEFFEKFEESKLALLYEDATAGGRKSRFNKLISRSSH